MSSDVNTSLLSSMLKSKRGKRGLRVIAQEIGDISASTLSRVEHGKIPDLVTFSKLCKWLEVKPDTFLVVKESKEIGINRQEEIKIHLRADQTLSNEKAEALIKMIEVVYNSEKEYLNRD